MAAWIGATDAQRLYQYTLPAAKRDIAEAPAAIMGFKAEVSRLWAFRAKHDRASYEYRAVMRRVKLAIRDLRSYQKHIQWSKDLVAKYGK